MTCIVILRGKLLHIDNILPLIFVLKKAGIISKPLFVVQDKKTFNTIKNNIALYKAIKAINGKIVCMNIHNNRIIRIIYNTFILKRYLYQKVLSIEVANAHVSKMAAFNKKIWKGVRLINLINLIPSILSRRFYLRQELVVKMKKGKVRVLNNYDYALLSYSKEQVEDYSGIQIQLNQRTKVIQVGYTRGLKEWQEYLSLNSGPLFSDEIKMTYFFYPLGTLGKAVVQEDNPIGEVRLRECLEVLKTYNNDLMTVFKPSAITEMDKVYKILKEIGYKNYIVSYAHPIQICKNARFTIASHHCTVLLDAYVLGCPTIEYMCYDSRIYNAFGGKSYLDGFVDYAIDRDQVALKTVLDKIIYSDVQVQRNDDKIKKHFPVLSTDKIKKLFEFIYD
jgi:hypothetical protein